MHYPDYFSIYLLLNDNTNSLYTADYVCNLLDFNNIADVMTAARDNQIIKPSKNNPLQWSKKELIHECINRLELKKKRILIFTDLPQHRRTFDYDDLTKASGWKLTMLKRKMKELDFKTIKAHGTRKHYFHKDTLLDVNKKHNVLIEEIEQVLKACSSFLIRA